MLIRIIEPVLAPFILEVTNTGILIQEVYEKDGKTKVINHPKVGEISHALGFISDLKFFRENAGKEMSLKEFVEGKQAKFNSLISAFDNNTGNKELGATVGAEETNESQPEEVADLQ